MSQLLLADIQRYANVPRMKGSTQTASLQPWLEAQGWRCTSDLLDLWHTVGTGVLFESEEVYAPDGTDEDVCRVTSDMQDMGFPPGFLVFHRGTWVSAVEVVTGDVVVFNWPSGTEVGRFPSCDTWYRTLIRSEFGARYGLAADNGVP